MSAVDGGPYREVREPDAAQLCPICAHERLEPVAIADAELPTCAACGGVFAAAPLMARITDARDPIAIALLDQPREKVASGRHRRLACPCCRAPMAPRPFAIGFIVQVDECATHGIWFDRGALREVASFVATGGFMRAEFEAAAARAQRGQLPPPYQPPTRWQAPSQRRPFYSFIDAEREAQESWRREAAAALLRSDAERRLAMTRHQQAEEIRRHEVERLIAFEHAHPVLGAVVRFLRLCGVLP